MPVPSKKDRHARLTEFFDVPVENRHDTIAVLHAESTAWTEIILHVDDQQCFANSHRFIFIIENDTVVAIETVGTNGSLNANQSSFLRCRGDPHYAGPTGGSNLYVASEKLRDGGILC